MRNIVKRILLHIRLNLVRAIFFPLFAFVDARNRILVRRQGEVVSLDTLRGDTGGVFCVFLLYPTGPFSGSVRRALTTLDALKINIVAVCNKPPLPADRIFLETVAHTIILRRNVGRDFGGYRTGILHVLDKFRPDRMIIANDSVYYLQEGLREFFSELCGEYDYVGAAENHEFGYHIGSYALGFGARVFRDPRFRRFWERYRLSELRPRVIKHGEIALNRLIIRKIGITPHVIYSPSRLASALARTDTRELIASAAIMPSAYQERGALDRLRSKALSWSTASGRAHEVPSGTLIAAALVAQIQTGDLHGLINADYRSDIERSLLTFMFRGSQIHWASALLIRHLHCPIVKTDLVIRSIYDPGELTAFIGMMPPDQFDEFFAIATRRGNPVQHWTLLQRMMLSVGYI